MRRLLAIVVTTALLAAGAVAAFVSPPVAWAAPSFALVHGSESDPRVLADVSDDGRYVLSLALTSGSAVVDRLTGAVHHMPDAVVGARHLSGDGHVLSFTTTAALLPSDTDDTVDAYSYDWTTSAFRFLSPGVGPGVYVNAGPMNADGSLVSLTILDGNFTSVRPVVSDGSTLTELASSLGPGPGTVTGISADGRFALVAKVPGCPDTLGCAPYQLFRVDRTTGAVQPVGRRSDGSAISPGASTELSANGECVAFTDQSNAVWKDCDFGIGTAQQLAASSYGTFDYSNLSISVDGTTVGWIGFAANAPVPPATTPGQAAHVLLRTDGGATVVVDALPGKTADGWAVGVRVVRPDLVVMNLYSTDVIDGAPAHRIIAYADGTVTPTSTTAPPTTTAPTTTAPPTTAPATTTPTTTTPATTAPTTTTTVVGSGGPVPGGAGAFTARTPVRIVDTRSGLGAPAGMPAARSSITIPVRGRNGVPADATAVAVQLTATDGTASGYVSLVPDAAHLGRSSTLNIDTPGETIANSAIVPIGADGSIVMYTMSPTHLIVDLAGWWTPTSGAVPAGRYRPVGPVRVLDTRPDSLVGDTGGKPAAGSITTVQISGRDGVPAGGVSAVIVNVTIDAPESLGFVQVSPAASLSPGSSSTLNVGRPGQVIAASAIVPVDAQGRIAIYAQPSTHLIVDVAGYFTAAGAAAGTDGLFVPTEGSRVDTRGSSGSDPRPVAGTRYDIVGQGGAIVGNVAVTDTAGPGFVQLGPADSMVNGATSNVNPTRAAETVANAFVVPTGASGRVGVFTANATHIVIDVTGYMTS
ncbi:MAG: hypothetical protein U0Q03_13575 [Acidimicrobiales bacterium]